VTSLRDRIRQRLADETGRIVKEAPYTVVLSYPSPYAAAMSSLGYQRIYRAIMETPGMACERAFLGDDGSGTDRGPERPLTYESERPLDAFPVVAVSVAYELEIGGLVQLLEAAGIPPRRVDRDDRHPLILAGGPLTFSNPLPLAGLVDAVIVGEAEEITPRVLAELQAVTGPGRRARELDRLATLPHVFVPSHHGSLLPEVARADDSMIPAWAPIRTPHAVLSGMFLVETERGCSRSCAYCVMRGSRGGGMRLAPMETILARVPDDACRVGLVGAAVSDHPKIAEIVGRLADTGREVGLSSLRPDRLDDALVGALRRAGTKTLTTAMDGASERLREALERHTRTEHLERCAALARRHGMERLKVYLMVGLPTETDDDIDACARLTTELSKIIPVSLGIAPFCAKRNTPLDGAPFAGVDVIDARLARLRRGVRGRVEVRATSAKWAWVEHALAQGGEAEGLAVIEAVHAGGTHAAYRRALGEAATSRSTRRGPPG
jgi:hypothetical protein